MVQSQKELIHGTNWDVLIILDACRFDVFEEVYDDYLEGDLRKVESEGSNTKEWLYKTFPDFYDIDYYSANPFINSLGLSLTKIADRCEYDYLASDHFLIL